MVAINFSVFLDRVENGTKCQTIRKKARCKPGDALQLYTGMRTKGCRKLRDAECVSVERITIHPDGRITLADGGEVTTPQVTAQRDGFEALEDMLSFFKRHYGLPFEGDMISWK